MEQEKELKDTFIEEYSSAKILKDMDNLKSAIILISKSLFALCDYILFKKYGKLPQNHKERFRILDIKEKDMYIKVSSVWSRYIDTYSKPSHIESYNLLNKTIINIIKNEEVDKEIKRIIEE
jgi:hypothetical protein